MGDISRKLAEPRYKGEASYFLAFNRNKKSMVLDLQTSSGKEAFYELVRLSDVVWDNFRPGVMEKMEADYDTLRELNPGIICCSITGYGSTGPYRDRPCFDAIAQGMSGIMSVTGERDGPPLRTGPSISDATAALFGALGVASTLAHRAKTGKGQKIEASLLGASMSILGYHFSSYFCSGVVPQRIGSGHQNAVPLGCYPTKDGYITIAAAWPRITRTLDLEWMPDDPRFSTIEQRLAHREECDRYITERLREQTSEFWLELLKADDISAGPVYTLDQVVQDPQVIEQNLIMTLNHPLGGKISLVGNPIKTASFSQGEEFTAPPLLGQHTHEILVDLLGYTEEKFKKLKREEKEHLEELKTHVQREL
jgi:Predicted acyl-CoA transferases/carnitine dehydratase